MIKKAVILCGGLGTRFLPITKSVPKEMLPLLDKPILQVLIEDLVKAGINNILIVLNKNKQCIINHFSKNSELENLLKKSNKLELLNKVKQTSNLANINYIFQEKQLGTGDALYYAKKFVGNDNFLIMFGDEVVFCKDENVPMQLIDCFNKYKKNVIAVQTCKIEDVSKYGIIKPMHIDYNTFNVLDIVEKPKQDEAPSNICYVGSAILTNEIFNVLDSIRQNLKCSQEQELHLTNALHYFAKSNNLIAHLINGKRIDTGNKFGFLQANIFAALNDVDCKENLIQFLKELPKNL